MGFEEEGPDDDCVIVITEEEVLQEASNRGFSYREAPDGISWEMSSGDKLGFFPKAFVAGGYTEEQLAMVEAAFDDCGVNLFPLGRCFH
jgi:hypothetical protein